MSLTDLRFRIIVSMLVIDEELEKKVKALFEVY